MKETLNPEAEILFSNSLESFNTCDDCGIIFHSMGFWYQHRQKHLCRSMGLETPAKETNKNHPMLCHFCDKMCSKLCYLVSHQKNHFKELFNNSNWSYAMPPVSCFSDIYPQQEEFKCEYCPKIFRFQWHLLQHKWDVHRYKLEEDQVTYECLCGEYFLLETNLKLHRKQACSYLSSSVTSMSKPKRPTRKSPKDPTFKCIYCYRTFLSEAYLERHMELHNDTTVSACKFCGKKFLEQGRLDRHLQKLHINNQTWKPNNLNYFNHESVNK